MGTQIKIIKVRGTCADDATCPTAFLVEGDPLAYVQGWEVSDPALLAAIGLPPGENVVAVPRSLLPEVFPRR